MSKKEIKRIVLVGLIIMAVLAIIFVTLAIVQPPKRTTRVLEYDLECTTELRKNPLQECKK